MFRVGFCVSGKGNLFASAVKHKDTLGIDPVLLITDEKADDFEDFCHMHKINRISLNARNRVKFDNELTHACINAKLDLIVLTFDKLLKEELVQAYNHRIINVHMALLPSFKGMYAQKQTVESGVKFSGASIHEVNNQMDAGNIVSQCIVSIRPGETVSALGKRLFVRLHPMYLQVIQWYACGRVTHDEQGRVWIRDADYSDDMICPRVELDFKP